jgi:hypothetical protein
VAGCAEITWLEPPVERIGKVSRLSASPEIHPRAPEVTRDMQEKDKQVWEQRSGVPVFSSINSVYSRACSGASNRRTSSDKILCTAARDEEYVLGRDWNICSFAAQEGLQWNW